MKQHEDDFFMRVRKWARAQDIKIETLIKESLGGSGLRDPISCYNGWRTRRVVPRGDYCVAIAKRLGLTAEFLITGRDPQAELSAMDGLLECADLAEKFVRLTETQKAMVREDVERMISLNEKKEKGAG